MSGGPGAPAGFPGFGPQALDFFRALGFHQSRDWFRENRHIYERDVLEPLGRLVAEVSERCASDGLPLRGDPVRAIFRLNRDIRFSKDKSPYKTSNGAILSRDGSRSSPGVLYVHVDPEGCFVAAGFHRPDPDGLAALRGSVRDRPQAWRALVEALAREGLAIEGEGALKRLPRGFEEVAEPDLAAAVRQRSFVTSRPLAGDRLRRPDLADDVMAFARAAMPLLDWGWAALDARPRAAGGERLTAR